MSAIVKLASKMPANIDLNGLDAQKQALIDKPEEVRYAVVAYVVEKITTTPKSGIEVPTVELTRFEPIGTADDLSDAVSEVLLQKAGERTGADPLPLDSVEVVDESGEGY